MMKPVNLVAIGGGTGLSTLLSGLKKFVGKEIASLTAVVTVSDDGGSSGRLRKEFQVLPPGDIRNCIVALSEDSLLISKLFQHRFSGNGELGGHSFGNLFLLALTELTGDFAKAIKLSSEILATKGHIYPATLSDVKLIAELEDGSIVEGETQVTKVGSKVKKLNLSPENCSAFPEAVEAIKSANIITVGPGSLYTSVIPPLLIKQIADEVASSKAVKIFISNLMTQPGETDGYSIERHLQVVKTHAPQINFDYLILNNRRIRKDQAEAYAKEGAEQIEFENVHLEGIKIIKDDLLDEGEKVRHNPEKLAEIILSCLEES
ncbi:MAG: YvcK family protein [Pyrinomonadaceae bacterium]|nr:YvcK family protein [Pyrinomonadaceae bacterium]MCX7640521.1 YvcK family protein [Pyrinomonadaceae bacterium]